MGFFRDTFDRVSDHCFRLFPWLSDPAARSTAFMKLALVMLHLLYLGVLLIFDNIIVDKFSTDPCYVLDALRDVNETDLLYTRSPMASKQPASSRKGSVIVSLEQSNLGATLLESNPTSWTKLVMDLYPPGSLARNWTCTYCNIVQPPRAKHCHDCDKCVLQFDHHCVWLGACIGQGNHCRFWWYIFEELALCVWTGILYIAFLNFHVSKAWWLYIIIIILLAILSVFVIFLLLLLLFHSYLVMTNRTTYELVRKRRIPYLRDLNERIYPFSKGVCKNLYNFCCLRSRMYMEPLPSREEIQEKSRPYTCLNVISCRCCC